MIIDNKYSCDGLKVFKTREGKELPRDEPLMLFRAQDRLMPELIRHYRQLSEAAGSPQSQLDLIDKTLADFELWQANHLTKTPD